MDVAVVDFTAPDAPETFTQSLRDTGFAVLVNHPIPWSLVEQIYREWSAFFDSPAVDRYLRDWDEQAGWFPADRSETAKGRSVRDLKEFFHVFAWSVYPDEVSDAALQYRTIATDLARTLLEWVEANTPSEIAERFTIPLSEMVDESDTLLRVLRYPPLPAAIPEGAERAAAHEDINLLTVLPASDQAGLELLGTNGGVVSRCRAIPARSPSTAVRCSTSPAVGTTRPPPIVSSTRPAMPPTWRGCRCRSSCSRPTRSCSPTGAPPASSSSSASPSSPAAGPSCRAGR